MRLVRDPVLPWLDVPFHCPRCDGTFCIEQADLGKPGIHMPKRVAGGWTVRATCPHCRRAGLFKEDVRDANGSDQDT